MHHILSIHFSENISTIFPCIHWPAVRKLTHKFMSYITKQETFQWNPSTAHPDGSHVGWKGINSLQLESLKYLFYGCLINNKTWLASILNTQLQIVLKRNKMTTCAVIIAFSARLEFLFSYLTLQWCTYFLPILSVTIKLCMILTCINNNRTKLRPVLPKSSASI